MAMRRKPLGSPRRIYASLTATAFQLRLLKLVALVLGVMLLLGVPAPAVAQEQIGTIIPGTGVVGLFELGRTYDESLALFKRTYAYTPFPTFQRSESTQRFFDFAQLGVRLVVVRGTVDQIVVLASDVSFGPKRIRIHMATRRGVNVGSHERDVLNAYREGRIGQANVVGGRVLYYSCIGFDISRESSLVRTIIVYKKRRDACET